MVLALTHPRTRSLLYGATAGVAIVLLGYLGYLFLFDVQSDSQPEQASKPSPGKLRSISSNAEIVIVRGTADLEQVLARKSPFGRAIALGNLLRHADEGRLGELYQLAGGVEESGLRMEVHTMILQALAFKNPHDALYLVNDLKGGRRSAMVEVVFAEWSMQDLDAATAHASSMNKADRRAAMAGILLGAPEAEKAKLFGIARQIGEERVLLNRVAQDQIRSPVDDPREALSLYLSRHGSKVERATDIERRLLTHIVSAWLESDGVDGIREVSMSLTSDLARATMLSDLLISLDENDSRMGLAVAVAMQGHDPDVLARSLAQWSDSAPLSALSMATRLDEEGGQSRMQRATLTTWAESDPSNLLDTLSAVPERFRVWSQRIAMLALARIAPEAAAERLDEMPDDYQRDYVMNVLVLRWAGNEPYSALEWAQRMQIEDPESPRDLTGAVLAGVSRSNPQLAMHMALGLPPNESGIGQEVYVIGQIARFDTEQAVELSNLARDDNTRHKALVRIGNVLARQDKYREAAELTQGVSADEQIPFLRWISVDWCWEYPQSAYEYFDNLPSGETQALYAELLLTQHSKQAFLDEENIHRLEHIVANTSGDHPAHSHLH